MWRNSEESLSLVQLEDLNNYTEISKFWTIDELQVGSLVQINVVFSPKPEKVIGLGRIEGKGYFLKSYDIAKRKLRGFKFDSFLKELGLDASRGDGQPVRVWVVLDGGVAPGGEVVGVAGVAPRRELLS